MESHRPRFFAGTAYEVVGHLGSRPVVVCLHGVGLDRSLWYPWIPVIATRYAIILIDLLGHGCSDNPAGCCKVSDFVEQVDQLIVHLQVPKIYLVGFSMGALIAQAFAAIKAEKLQGMILLHSVYQRTEAQCRSVKKRYEITKSEGPAATVEPAIKRWFSPEYTETQVDEMDAIRDIFREHRGDGYEKAYRLFAHAEDAMREISVKSPCCPALIITGSLDFGSTPAMSAKLCADIPDAELIINPGHRHMAPREHAATLANQVLLFLNRCDSSNPGRLD